jgi:pectate disaccharide-lyase
MRNGISQTFNDRAPVSWIAGSALILALLSGRLYGSTYYVAADGNEGNDGSKARPWPSVEFALSKAGGGNTIILRPGIYRGPIEIAKRFAGTAQRPTIIQSESKWKAVIIGAPVHAISNSTDCHHLVIDGFEVLGARYDGIKVNGNSNTVRNCWVHNNGHMGIGAHNQTGTVIENNLIEFNGQHVQFHHGVYASGDHLAIRGNVVRHNAGYGLHLYSSIRDSVISQNVVYGHPRQSGIIVSCPKGGGRNVIVHNTVVDNDGALLLWQGDGEVVANNIFLADKEVLAFENGTKNVTSDYNLCVPPSTRQGPHGFSADPQFVDAHRGVFWLRPNSPAIGKGSSEYAPTRDFWGKPGDKEQATDLGACSFKFALITDVARAGWHYHWPYRFAPDQGRDLPDPWLLPK